MQKDIFVEKLVKHRKTGSENLLSIMIILSAFFLIIFCFLLPFVYIKNFLAVSAIVSFGIGYLAYRIVISFNRDYEYSITNDELLIEQIIAQRKRNRVFIGSVKDFSIAAPISGSDYETYCSQKIFCLDFRSGNNDEDGWFFVTRKSGSSMMILFEPDDRFIDAFKKYIPRFVKTV